MDNTGIQKLEPQRNSSIELIKIIAMIMIVISHSMSVSKTSAEGTINIHLATGNVELILAQLCRYLGAIGNNVFLIGSSWFLLNSRSAKPSKIISMILDSFLLSVSLLLAVSGMGYEIPFLTAVKQFFPITFGNNWFLTCYLLMYAVHPILNVVVEHIGKRDLGQINLGFLTLYCGIGLVLNGGAYFFSEFVGFVGVYFLTAYWKKYLHPENVSSQLYFKALIVGIIGWIGVQVGTNVVGLVIPFFKDSCMRLCHFYNPLILLIGFSMVSLSLKHTFCNRLVNRVSGLSLLIYLIHENNLVAKLIRPDVFLYWERQFGNTHIVGRILAYAGLSFVISIGIAGLYTVTVQRVTEKIGRYLGNRFFARSKENESSAG